MVTRPRDRAAAAVTSYAHRPRLPLAGEGKGGFAAVVVTNESDLVDLFVTISFFWMATPARWPGRHSVTKGD